MRFRCYARSYLATCLAVVGQAEFSTLSVVAVHGDQKPNADQYPIKR